FFVSPSTLTNLGTYKPVGRRPKIYLSSYPSIRPPAPQRKWWSIALCPSSPELLPSPPSQTSVAEFINIQVELKADAQTKITFAKNSYVLFVSASTISTPFAFCVSLS